VVPHWFLSLAVREEPGTPCPGALPTVSRSRLVSRAATYLRKVPPAVSGQGGHAHTFLTACRLVRGFALDVDETYALMCEWNRACRPPWSERDLRRKIEQALEHGHLPFGALLDAETT
jgi:putative DNA primase/helicase